MSAATSTILGIAGIAAGVGGGITSSIVGSNAAGNAADTQSQAAINAAQIQAQSAAQALAQQNAQFNTTQQNIAPWLHTGSGALANLGYLLGIPSQYRASSATAPSSGSPTPTPTPTPSSGGVTPPIVNPIDPITGSGASGFTNGSTVNGTPLSGPSNGGPKGGPNQYDGLSAQPEQSLPMDGNLPLDSGLLQSGNGTTPTGTDITPSPVTPSTPSGVLGATPQDGLDPQINTSLGAFGSLMQPYGQTFTAPTDVTEQNDPGYQFRLQQGQQALERSAAARGNLLNGGTAKALTQYGQDYASNEYSNVYNRALGQYQQNYNIFQQDQTNQFNRLAAVAGVGQTAAGQLATAGQNAANNSSQILLNSGNAQAAGINNAAAATASGYIGGANAITGGISGVSNNLSQLAILNQILHGGAMDNNGATATMEF